MADSKADDIIREHEQLASTRGLWENQWREVAERVRPNQNFFQQRVRTEGDKRTEKIFDDTAPLALPKFAAAVISMSFPATQRWHRIAALDPEIDEQPDVRVYCDRVTDILFKMRYSPAANFQSQIAETVLDIGAFGTGVMFIDDIIGSGIRYKSFPLAESYIAEDAHGRVDTMYRKFQLTAHQAATAWGAAKLPEAIQQMLERNKNEKFWFIHAVRPNVDKKPGRRDYTGMEYYSCYVAMDARKTIDEGGYRTFPFAVPRYETGPREVYGRGPAMQVLPTIKMLNEAQKSIIRAAQKVVEPPVMLTEDGSLQPFNLRSNALNYGYVDNNGRALAQPFNSGARVEIGVDLINQWREVINDAFFVTLFRILVEEPQITATEAMLRAQEKGQLLAPTMGRVQAEIGGPMIQRELDIAMQAGILPEMPDALREHEGKIKIEYESPLNLAQKSSQGISVLNTLNGLAPLAQIDPTIMQMFDLHESAKVVAMSNGFPQKAMLNPKQVAAKKKQNEQQAGLQQVLQAAPVAAAAAKDLAQAQSLTAASPNAALPAIIPQGA